MNDLVILGAGAVGRQVAEIVQDVNSVGVTWNLVGYVDDDVSKVNETVAGAPILGNLGWLSSRNHLHDAVAIGLPQTLIAVHQRFKELEHQRVATLVHPSVCRSSSTLGQRFNRMGRIASRVPGCLAERLGLRRVLE